MALVPSMQGLVATELEAAAVDATGTARRSHSVVPDETPAKDLRRKTPAIDESTLLPRPATPKRSDRTSNLMSSGSRREALPWVCPSKHLCSSVSAYHLLIELSALPASTLRGCLQSLHL